MQIFGLLVFFFLFSRILAALNSDLSLLSLVRLLSTYTPFCYATVWKMSSGKSLGWMWNSLACSYFSVIIAPQLLSVVLCILLSFYDCFRKWGRLIQAITLGSEQSLIIYYVDFHLISQIVQAYLGDTVSFVWDSCNKASCNPFTGRGSHLRFVKNATSRSAIKWSMPVYISILSCVRDPQSRDFASLPRWEKGPNLETSLVFCQARRGVVHLTGGGGWIKLSV